MNQTEAILAALEQGEALTPMDALRRFGCMRLGARIWELKEEGKPILDEMIGTGKGKHVKRYFLDPAYLDAKRAHEAAEEESQEVPAGTLNFEP